MPTQDEQEQEKNTAGEPGNESIELDECKTKCEEYLNSWKRAKADFINYKKEEFERSQELMRFTKESFLENPKK